MSNKSALLYADSGFVTSTNSDWLQWDFDVMFGLFETVVQQKNVMKTVAMVYQLSPIVGRHSIPIYKRRIT